jgi:hypothetical protein
MSKKLLSSILFASLFLLLLGSTTGWAEDPSSLIVVRASDNSLWKKTCLGDTCTAFSSFPGMFSSQPTVFWDEVLLKYVLWGRASDNSIWRSTFSSSGTFDNNWASVPGASPSPMGAAGSTLIRPGFNGNLGGQHDAATVATCDTYTDLNGFDYTFPRDGFVIVSTGGLYSPTTADRFIRVCIGDTAGGACDSWSPILESTTAMMGGYAQEKMFTLQYWYYATAGTTKTIHLKACKEAGTTGNILWNDFIMNFVVIHN